jgi:SAM-dependent methyltransferase
MKIIDERDLFDFVNAFDPEYYLYFYESILTPERLKSELDFLIRYTELNYPMRILDVACGYGRHANQLAKLGHLLTGLDTSALFLDIAKADAEKLDVQDRLS